MIMSHESGLCDERDSLEQKMIEKMRTEDDATAEQRIASNERVWIWDVVCFESRWRTRTVHAARYG